MKQKSSEEGLLTKKDLHEILQINSKNTLEKLETLQKEIRRELSATEIRLDIKLEKMELRMDDRARIYNSQVLTRFDQWANDLRNAQTEQIITADQLTKLHQDIDNIKKRITKLEAS